MVFLLQINNFYSHWNYAECYDWIAHFKNIPNECKWSVWSTTTWSPLWMPNYFLSLRNISYSYSYPVCPSINIYIYIPYWIIHTHIHWMFFMIRIIWNSIEYTRHLDSFNETDAHLFCVGFTNYGNRYIEVHLSGPLNFFPFGQSSVINQHAVHRWSFTNARCCWIQMTSFWTSHNLNYNLILNFCEDIDYHEAHPTIYLHFAMVDNKWAMSMIDQYVDAESKWTIEIWTFKMWWFRLCLFFYSHARTHLFISFSISYVECM